MFRGEGEMDSHFWKCFWVILLNSSFWTMFVKDHGNFFSLFFYKKITPCPSMNLVFSERAFEEILTLFELWWKCLVKVDDNTQGR